MFPFFVLHVSLGMCVSARVRVKFLPKGEPLVESSLGAYPSSMSNRRVTARPGPPSPGHSLQDGWFWAPGETSKAENAEHSNLIHGEAGRPSVYCHV